MDKLTEKLISRNQIKASVIEKLASNHGTGKYVFDPVGCRSFIKEIKKSFNNFSIDTSLAYSIKANYHKSLLDLAIEEGLSFDCASLEEIEIALETHISKSRIWLNSPFLNDELLRKCVRDGIRIHVDTIDQLGSLQKEAAKQQKSVEYGIRFNFPEIDNSRFGIEVNEANLHRLKSFLVDCPNLELKVLHTHFSGADRSASKFANRAEAIFRLYDQHFRGYKGLKLNLGGGISGPMTEQLAAQFDTIPPMVTDYASALRKAIAGYDLSDVSMIIEPGMALAAHAFYFLAEVMHIKEINGQSIALLNASNLFLKPTGHSKRLSFTVVPKNKGFLANHLLTGITCMESDILGEYKGELAVGDLILFNNSGAYTMSYRPDFIFSEPETILLEEKLINELN